MAFLDSKITKLKKSKFLFFARSTSKMCFDVILESQKAFLDYKKQKVKKVHGFGKKFEIFPCFYFLQKTASKMCLTIF